MISLKGQVMKFQKSSPIKTQADFNRALKQLGYTQSEFKTKFGYGLREVRGVYFCFEAEETDHIEKQRYYLTERSLTIK